MTVERHESTFSRRNSPELCIVHHPRKVRGHREGRVAAAPGAPAQKIARRAREPQVQAGFARPSLRGGLRVIRALPRETAFATVPFPKLSASPGLSACMGAPGPHDFAVRADAAHLTASTRPPHSAPRS